MLSVEPLPGGDRRLPSLTGMRIVAAGLVFLCHSSLMGYFTSGAINDAFFGAFGRAGYIGVEFFFILSGFVLAWTARDGDTLWAFWRRRAVKIFPNNTVAGVSALVLIVASGGTVAFWPAAANFLLVQTWLPDMDLFNGVNPPSWSLSCELLFYALFPLVFRGVRALSDRLLWPMAGGLVGVVMVTPVVATLLPREPVFIFMDVPFPQMWFVYGFPPVRMLDFTLGIVLALIVRRGRWPGWGLMHVMPLVVIGYLVNTQVPLLYSMSAVMIVPLGLLVAAGAADDLAGRRSPLRGRVMLWLGEVSFAFYMLHVLVILYGTSFLPQRTWSTPAATAVVIGTFVVTLVLGAVLYHGVERPVTRRWSRPRRADAPPASPRPQVTAR